MDVGVVGAGIFGVAAALELRRRGHRVTVFDRGPVPHPEASSTDVSKGIRRVWYAGDNETYVELAERAAFQWRAWERRLGAGFYRQVGGLNVVGAFEPGTPMFESVRFLQGRGAPVEVLSSREAAKRYPQFTFAPGEVAVYDPWAGYIESGRAVSQLTALARESGVDIEDAAPVASVRESSGGVEVDAAGRWQGFDRVVVAAGVWVGRLLPEIGRHVRVTHQEMLLIEPEDPAPFRGGTMPVWSVDPDGEGWYGFPMLSEGYVKVSKEPLGDTVDPDMDRGGTAGFAEQALAFLRKRIPEMAMGRAVEGRSCLYTSTPDDHFVIDWAPGHSRVLVAGGGSGHGFKFGGSIGPLIADALEGMDNQLGALFRIGDRFRSAARRPTESRGFARPAR